MIKKVFSLLIIMIIAASANAEKLELYNKKNDKSVRIINDTLVLKDRDSVIIDEIVVLEGSRVKKLMTVVVGNNNGDTLFQDSIKRSMSVNEMGEKKFALKPGNTYTVSWDSTVWTIEFKETNELENQSTNSNDKKDANKELESASWTTVIAGITSWTTVIVGIICLIIGLLLGIKRKKIKKLFKKKEKPLLEILKSVEEFELNCDAQQEEVYEKLKSKEYTSKIRKILKCSGEVKDEEVINILREKLDIPKPPPPQCPDPGIIEATKKDIVNVIISRWGDKFYQEKSLDDKITCLKGIIDDYYNLLDEKNTLFSFLELEEGATIEEIINKIKDKITIVSQPLPPSDELIKKIEGFILKCAEINRYYKEKCSEADSFEGRIESLFSFLDYALRTAEKSKEKPLQDLQKRLEHMTIADMCVVNNFVLGKLKDAGIGNFVTIVMNTKLETVLQDLTRKLEKADQADERDTDQEIVSKAVENNNFTDKDKRILLENLVEKINENIGDDDKKLSDIESFEQLYQKLSTSILVPNSYEEAENKGKKIVLDAISLALGLEVADCDKLRGLANTYFEKRLQTELLSKLKGLDFENKTEVPFVVDTIKNAFKDSLDVSNLFKELNVDYVSGIPNAIIKREAEKIKKTLAGKSDFPKELELDKCKSSEQIVNRLVRALDEANKEANAAEKNKQTAEVCIIDELKDNFKALANEDMQEPKTVFEAFEIYGERVKSIISEKTNSLEQVKNDKKNLQTKVEEQAQKMQKQKDAIDVVTASVINNFKNGIDDLDEILRKGGFLKACDNESKESCSKNENRIISAMERFRVTAESLVLEDKLPLEIFEEIQSILASECSKEDGVFNLVSRYYAYSRLPFMTDKIREYGARFDRSVLSKIYTVMDKLLSAFDCQLILPTLFSERITEGEYEDCTGAVFGDLDNLCPNSLNYKEFITNSDKKDVIIDIIHIGYRMNGSVKMKTKVLI